LKTICIDAGNSLIKVAYFEESVILSVASFSLEETDGLLHHIESLSRADACIVSSVSVVRGEVIDVLQRKSAYFMELTSDTPVPVCNLYKTPESLGKDRLAAIVGANSLFPNKDILVFDFGTAMTVDFIDENGNYHGGNISPGLNMRFRALHDYTKKLSLQSPADDYRLLGDTSATAIISGVQNGMLFEVNNYIDHFIKLFPDLIIIFTGGDIFFFADKIFKCTFAEPNLVVIGLEKIIKFNINKGNIT
jgi:type III pantothenate kinase